MFTDNLRIIDSHFHIRGLNEGRLISLLSVSDEIRRKLNLDNVCVAAIPAWDHVSVGQNVLCAAYKALHPGAYAYAGLDHYAPGTQLTREGYLKQAQLFEEIGFDGLKIIESKPTCRRELGVGLDDERFQDCFAFLESHGTPILWHVADPEENWYAEKCNPFVIRSGWCYEGGGFASKEALYRETERVLKRHPNLNAVFAHLYFLGADMPRLRAFLDAYPSVRVDVTPGCEMYYHFARDPDLWHAFFTEYAHRVVFGTDNGWGDDASAAQKVVDGCQKVLLLDAFFSTDQQITLWDDNEARGLNLSKQTLQSIYRDNFMDMHQGRAPKALNLKLAAEYASGLADQVAGMPDVPSEYIQQLQDAAALLKRLS